MRKRIEQLLLFGPSLVVLLVVAGAPRAQPDTPPAPAPVPGDAAAARERAREVLEPYCGLCHIGGTETAIPAALAIFDLSRPDWDADLDLDRMRSVIGRLDGALPPDGNPSGMSPEEVALVTDYLHDEAARRWQVSF